MASVAAAPGPPAATVSTVNAANLARLEQQVAELLVSSYDPVLGKTIWQCAQCHFSSKFRYTVKEHIETHISGFTHQCPHCVKTCKTRNALRAHVMRAHSARPPGQQPPWAGGAVGGDRTGVGRAAPRRPRQRRPYDEELERQIRLLLLSSYDPAEVKTTWRCAQCGYSSKLQYTVKQHIETHITSIVHQCAQCPKILKTRNALRAHMNQKHEDPGGPGGSPSWMGGEQSFSPGPPCHLPQLQYQRGQLVPAQPHHKRKRSEAQVPPSPMDAELDRQVAELMVSNFDAVAAKTTWQCAQCHFSSKIRSTVKEHIETHISGFTHQCQYCVKTCKTRNALRVHTIRAHNKPQLAQQILQQAGGHSPPKICYEPQQGGKLEERGQCQARAGQARQVYGQPAMVGHPCI
jgi:hypothetical protein